MSWDFWLEALVQFKLGNGGHLAYLLVTVGVVLSWFRWDDGLSLCLLHKPQPLIILIETHKRCALLLLCLLDRIISHIKLLTQHIPQILIFLFLTNALLQKLKLLQLLHMLQTPLRVLHLKIISPNLLNLSFNHLNLVDLFLSLFSLHTWVFFLQISDLCLNLLQRLASLLVKFTHPQMFNWLKTAYLR